MLEFSKKILSRLESAPLKFSAWLASFLAIITLRILVEHWLAGFRNRSVLFLFFEFSHTFLFFLLSYLVFCGIIYLFTKSHLAKIFNVVLGGFLMILSPPIIDWLISRGKGFWSFYKFDGLAGLSERFFTFFGDRPDIGITYGVRIEVALAVVFLFTYSFIKTNRLIRSLAIAFWSYLAFFVLGTFPSWIELLLSGPTKGFLAVTDVDVATRFLAPANIFSWQINDLVSSLNIKMSLVYALLLSGILISGFFLLAKKPFLAFLKNIRPPQVLYHLGLLLVGLGLSLFLNQKNWTWDFFDILGLLLIGEAVVLAWLATVVVNDCEDLAIDTQTNPQRPLIENSISKDDYRKIGWVLFGSSLFFSALVSPVAALLILGYHAVAWLYSAPPLRLKRFAFISTFVSAIASLLVVFIGYILVSPSQSLENFPAAVGILLVLGYTLSLPLKDFKDIAGDRADGVFTLPVIFGEPWGKVIVASGIFTSFMLSIFLVQEPRLFLWALLFGGLAFWTVINMKNPTEQSRIHPIKSSETRATSSLFNGVNYRNIFWWMLGIVAGYGIILVKIVFF